MGKPVVVSGQPVASPYEHNTFENEMYGGGHPTTTTAAHHPTSGGGGGEKQPNRCRDPVFAVLLYINVAAIGIVAGVYGTSTFTAFMAEATSSEEATTTNTSTSSEYNYTGYIYSTFILGALSMIFTAVTLPIMMAIPQTLIKCSLLMMLVLSGVMMVSMFLMGQIIGAIFGVIFFLLTCCYTYCVWSRIPFASVNLLTACTAIRKNAGVVFLSFILVVLAFAWTLLWAVALAGVSDTLLETTQVTVNGQTFQQTNPANYGYLFLLLLSYFFTHQVIQNVTHVTVAGTVGAWWFGGSSGCCAAGMLGSFIRAMTTSFGSICFGSLLVAIVQALKALVNSARNGDNQILVCIADCILGCIESLLEYFNKWAFIYVGLYGYGYIEAGKNVMTLFRNRGWEAIIADDLVGNVFFILSMCVGGLCAAIGYFIGSNPPEGWFENSPTSAIDGVDSGIADAGVCAFLGFIAGLVLSSILYSSIASAVNTVIVCFAEGPAEFEANHPELSRKMRECWLAFYPDCGV